MKILIAEDDVMTRKMLERMLAMWEFEVVVTTNGQEAWQELQKEDAPKLVMLDWMMPEMHGIDVTQKLREIKTDNPPYILLLTAKSEKADIVKALELGANDFITKPFDRTELHARLNVGQRVLKLQQELIEKITELQHASEHIQTLQGILPICMHCHKIRTDDEAWEGVDIYVERHSDAQFSHGLCPDCLDKYYPDDGEDKLI